MKIEELDLNWSYLPACPSVDDLAGQLWLPGASEKESREKKS